MACIQGFHSIAAHFGGPHWLMNEEDAKNYAIAVNNVARHMDLEVAQKTIDICNLIGLACFYEGTRVLYSRRQPQQQRPAPMGQVFQFSPPVAPPPVAPQPAVDDPPPGEGALH